MLLGNVPFSLDAHLQSPFDPTADLCEVEVLRNNTYVREMKALENDLRARTQKPLHPRVEYFFTSSQGLESVSFVGTLSKELPLTRERAERAYLLIDAVVASLSSPRSSALENRIMELLRVQGYAGEEAVMKSIDYEEKKMLAILKHLQNDRSSYFERKQFVNSNALQQQLPQPEGYYREDLANGSTLYRTHQRAFGRHFITTIMVTPILLSPTRRSWHLEASTILDERPVPLCTMEQYCLHLDELEEDFSTMVKRLELIWRKHLKKGDIRIMPEEKRG